MNTCMYTWSCNVQLFGGCRVLLLSHCHFSQPVLLVAFITHTSCPSMQAAVKGSYTPLADTLKQVDSVTKDDVIKVC